MFDGEFDDYAHECTGPIFVSHTCDHDVEKDHQPWGSGCQIVGCECIADWEGC